MGFLMDINCKQHVFILEPNCQFYTYTANNIWTRKNYQLTNRFFTQINHLDCQKSYFSSKLLWKSVFGSQSAIRQCNGGVSRALDYLIMANTDKRTDVWFRPSCIYTQIFSPKNSVFFMFSGSKKIRNFFFIKRVLCNFSVRTL